MLTDKELGEAWFGSQAEVKHLKAVLKLKETHILTPLMLQWRYSV